MNIPILLLHGALGAQTQLQPLRQLLEDSNKEVFTMNFSGHNGIPFSSNGFGIEIFAEDIHHFLKQRKIEHCDIFGYSMGGYVALWFAYRYPSVLRNIITLGSKFDWSPESAEREIKKLNPELIQEKVPAFARLLEHRHAPNNWKELIHRTSVMMHELGQSPLLTQSIVSTIDQRCVVLLGDHDDMADRQFSEQIAGWLPRGEFHLLKETPHPIEKVNLEILIKWIIS